MVFEKVCAQLHSLVQPDAERSAITAECLLVEDLGMDSMKFVTLTVQLEEALSIGEFPMQAWIDEQIENVRPLTVGELAQACERLLVGTN